MNRPDSYLTRLDAWHLELGILADSLDYVLGGLDGPDGLQATAHVLKARLRELLEACPFPSTAEVADLVSETEGGQP